jgi:hypothetical protein
MASVSPPSRSAVRAALDRHEGAILVLMNLMLVRHLIDVYREFEGDMVAAIVLGEIAHHNLSPLINRAPTVLAMSQALREDEGTLRQSLLPTNTFSIAQGTGIPRETVRRKVATLARRGWIERDGKGNLYVAPGTHDAFSEFHVDRLLDLLTTSRAIEALVKGVRRP